MAITKQIITPFRYHAKGLKAVDSHNVTHQPEHTDNENKGELSELQSLILECLKDEPKGLRSLTLMRRVRNKINPERFYNALNSMMYLKYIIRNEYGARSVYYSITLAGRIVLDELNEILISIVHNRPL